MIPLGVSCDDTPRMTTGRLTMTTLGDALRTATAYWEAKGPTSRMMPIRARKCMDLASLTPGTPIDGLTPSTGTLILTALRNDGLSKASIGAYYTAFRRMLALSGVFTGQWPKAGSPPRRVREPMLADDLKALIEWLRGKGYHGTADLAILMRDTGCRVEVEALNPKALHHDPLAGILRITGKGDHERVIPVEVMGPAHQLLQNGDRMRAMRRVSYSGHLRRWNEGVTALGISSRLPTHHSVRHQFATLCHERSGRDLGVVRELLGHSNIQTTARYVGVDMGRMRHAVGA